MKYYYLLILLIVFLASPLYAEPALYIGSAFESPVSTPDQRGIVDRLVIEAFSRIGAEAVITHLPAERSLLNTSQGINDGDLIRVAGLQYQYPDLVKVHEKLIDFEFVAFTRDAQSRIDNWGDLSHYSVGIVRGWKILEEKAAHSLLTQVDSLELLFTLLEKGRADLVIYERLAGIHAIQAMRMRGVYQLEPPLEVQPMYLYLHRAHRNLVDPLVSVLREMKQDGTFERIFADALATLNDGGSQ